MRRIIFEVEDEVFNELQDKLPWGQRRAVYETITKDLLYLMRMYPPSMIIGAIVSEEVGISEISNYIKNKDIKDGK